jgi:hypothetical protein
VSPEASQEATPEEGGGSRCLEGAQEDSRSLGGLDTSWIPVGYQLDTSWKPSWKPSWEPPC